MILDNEALTVEFLGNGARHGQRYSRVEFKPVITAVERLKRLP